MPKNYSDMKLRRYTNGILFTVDCDACNAKCPQPIYQWKIRMQTQHPDSYGSYGRQRDLYLCIRCTETKALIHPHTGERIDHRTSKPFPGDMEYAKVYEIHKAGVERRLWGWECYA